MKKFLLVLSCFLATWCSVQAGPKSSPEISLMQASAPAADPTSKYPAVINSAYHDPYNHVIVVKCDQKDDGALAFFTELGGNRPEIYRDTKSSPGTGKTVKIPLKPEWEMANYFTILISVGDGVNICGGYGVKLEHPDPAAKINKISYIPANKKVRVEYSIINPKSEACYIKVHKNSKTGKEVFKAGIEESSTMCEIPSSKFTKGALYYVEISVGNLKVFEKYIYDNVRSGYMGKVSFDDDNSRIVFNYNLKNASNPCIAIKKGSKDGPIVKKIEIENTNGDYMDAFLYSYRAVLKEKTTYVADLYDGSEDLRIFSEYFTIPESTPVKRDHDFSCRWEPSKSQFHIVLTKTDDPNVTVSIWVEPINGGTYQYTVSKDDPNKDYYFGVSIKGYYVVRVVWSDGVEKSTTILR